MKGWTIFVHSLRLVIRNFEQALRVSALLFCVQIANQVMVSGIERARGPVQGMDGPMMQVDPADAGLLLILSIASVLASLWIAVAWHRFVLEEEYPAGWVPAWHGSETLAYLGRSLMLGLLIALALVVAMIPAGILMAGMPGLAPLVGFGLVGLAGYLFFRLGVMLPAAAIGERMPLREAWAATRDDDGAVVVLALIVMGGSAVVQAPSFMGGAGTTLDLIYRIVTGWFATMIGISVLTTLYGHYVQGRPID